MCLTPNLLLLTCAIKNQLLFKIDMCKVEPAIFTSDYMSNTLPYVGGFGAV